MVKIVITGANGQLGSDLCRHYLGLGAPEIVQLRRRDLDLCEHGEVSDFFESIRPDVVINTAAFHKLEQCEEEPGTAFAVNCHAVRNLAQVCSQIDAHLVHVSTDYVFGGVQKNPYTEDAPLNPQNVYGVSKMAGEFFVKNLAPKHTIIRTSGLYGVSGASGKGGNFVETMLRLGRERGTVSVVNDQTLSPTYTADLAWAIAELVEHEAKGVFHVTNSSCCSWYEFAKAIMELSGVDADVLPTTTAEFSSTVPRPSYSVLSNRRLKEIGIGPLRPWREALKAYLQSKQKVQSVSINSSETVLVPTAKTL